VGVLLSVPAHVPDAHAVGVLPDTSTADGDDDLRLALDGLQDRRVGQGEVVLVLLDHHDRGGLELRCLPEQLLAYLEDVTTQIGDDEHPLPLLDGEAVRQRYPRRLTKLFPIGHAFLS